MMGCCGDVPTLETLAAVAILRERLPELKVRVVNVVDLMRLQPESEHPHGLSDTEFDAIFTRDRPIVFAYHGYPWLIHLLRERGLSVDELDRALEHDSGLAALGGLDELLGFEVYTYRVAQAAAAMAAALGGLDALAFSGGVGENRTDVRAAIAARLAFVGTFAVEVVPAREDVVVARAVRALLATGSGSVPAAELSASIASKCSLSSSRAARRLPLGSRAGCHSNASPSGEARRAAACARTRGRTPNRSACIGAASLGPASTTGGAAASVRSPIRPAGRPRLGRPWEERNCGFSTHHRGVVPMPARLRRARLEEWFDRQ